MSRGVLYLVCVSLIPASLSAAQVRLTPLLVPPVLLPDRPGVMIESAQQDSLYRRHTTGDDRSTVVRAITRDTDGTQRNAMLLATVGGPITLVRAGEPLAGLPGPIAGTNLGIARISRDGAIAGLMLSSSNQAVFYGGRPASLQAKLTTSSTYVSLPSEPGINGFTTFIAGEGVLYKLYSFDADRSAEPILSQLGPAPGFPPGHQVVGFGTVISEDARLNTSGGFSLVPSRVRMGDTSAPVERVLYRVGRDGSAIPTLIGGTPIADEPGYVIGAIEPRGGISDDGTVFASAPARHMSGSPTLGSGLYIARPSAPPERLLQVGRPFAPIPSWNVQGLGSVVVGRNRHAAVSLSLSQPGNTTGRIPLMSWHDDAWAIIAEVGQTMPGGGTLSFLSSVRIEGDSLAVSDDGAVAFIAGNGDAERTALYIRDSGGTLHHVFSEGDTVSAPGLPSFQLPYQSFNPSSIGPVFASSEGHFVVTAAGRVLAVSVPEPAGLALLAFTVALLAGTGKRHRRCAP